MLKNLLIISWRTLKKDKVYTLINAISLTIGITSSLFLLLYILDETSYDRYHTRAENIYRIVSHIKEPDNEFTWATTQAPMAETLKESFPEIENAVRFIQMSRNVYSHLDKKFTESKFYLTDSTVFKMFTYGFLAGDPKTALTNSHCIVISESIANKYFAGPEDALGESLVNQQGESFKITGIIEDVPRNSHFRFDALVSKSSRPQLTGSWGSFGIFTYIQLPAGYDPARMKANFERILLEKVNPVFEKFGIKVAYELQRITDIHLYSHIADEAEGGGDVSYLYIFGVVALLILVIACINYMNLSTARSINRAKEVGIRKVMGSERQLLIYQFLIESTMVSLMALAVSLFLLVSLLPLFNTVADKSLNFNYILQPHVTAAIIGIVIFTGIVGGSYPAFYLSRFSPSQVLKGNLVTKKGGLTLRKSLVVLQFGLSIFMLISTLVVYDQLKFLRKKDLGFDKDNIIRIQLSGRDQFSKAQVFLETLRQKSEIRGAAMANASPGQPIDKGIFQVEDREGKMVERGVDLFSADYDYIKTMGMTIIEGRDFSREIPADTTYGVLVNESMVRRMSWKDPLGKRFVVSGQPEGSPIIEKRVVGVINDYNQNSLYDPIEPLMIILSNQNNYVFVRTMPGDPEELVSSIREAWASVFPNDIFEFKFLNQDLDSQYHADQKRSQLFTAFSTLTILIACLGLLGLAAFATSQRTKEIGIRKVVGASVPALVLLIVNEFVVLVLMGIITAFPTAWYFTNQWLQHFTYRIELLQEWTTFLLAASAGLLVTLLTCAYHVLKAAIANPVQALRDE